MCLRPPSTQVRIVRYVARPRARRSKQRADGRNRVAALAALVMRSRCSAFPLLLWTRATAVTSGRAALVSSGRAASVSSGHAASAVAARSPRDCPQMVSHDVRPALITFDCTGTLFEPRESVGSLYKAAMLEAAADGPHAAAAAALHIGTLNGAFASAYKEAEERQPCFGAGVVSSETWWLHVVRTTLERAGAPKPTIDALLQDAFDALYHRVFVSEDSWRLTPGAEEALRALCAWRGAQVEGERTALGVVANWDERLPLLLEQLGILHLLDVVITSREVGAEKPAGEIFAAARVATGVPDGARAVHVGDTFARDVIGAVGASWEAILLTSEKRLAARSTAEIAQMEAVPHTKIVSLRELTEALDLVL